MDSKLSSSRFKCSILKQWDQPNNQIKGKKIKSWMDICFQRMRMSRNQGSRRRNRNLRRELGARRRVFRISAQDSCQRAIIKKHHKCPSCRPNRKRYSPTPNTETPHRRRCKIMRSKPWLLSDGPCRITIRSLVNWSSENKITSRSDRFKPVALNMTGDRVDRAHLGHQRVQTITSAAQDPEDDWLIHICIRIRGNSLRIREQDKISARVRAQTTNLQELQSHQVNQVHTWDRRISRRRTWADQEWAAEAQRRQNWAQSRRCASPTISVATEQSLKVSEAQVILVQDPNPGEKTSATRRTYKSSEITKASRGK